MGIKCKFLTLWLLYPNISGVVYITYSKTSEAVHALEEMNGQVIEGNPKPIKVMLRLKTKIQILAQDTAVSCVRIWF